MLSNMPEIDCQDEAGDPGLKVVKFGTSPIMSTYLVAITVGEFDYIEAGVNILQSNTTLDPEFLLFKKV